LQHFIAGGWSTSGIRTFVQSIHDHENGKLSWEFEDGFETIRKIGLAGTFGTVAARLVQLIKDIPAAIRVMAKLEEKGRQRATDMALGGILEVEVMIRDQGRRLFSRCLDIFDNGGADQQHELRITEIS